MSRISGAYECHYSWPLPEVNITIVWFDDTICEQPALVRHGPHLVTFSSAWSQFTEYEFVLARVQIWNSSYPFAQFKFLVYGHEQTYTRVLKCSSASVGLAQARPNK